MKDWVWRIDRVLENKRECVLVTVVRVAGSTPREAGSTMLVTGTEISGTIGGGVLEYQAIEFARALLVGERNAGHTSFTFGPGSGQCCGGVADMLFERITPEDLDELRGEVLDAGEKTMVTTYHLERGHSERVLYGAGGAQSAWPHELREHIAGVMKTGAIVLLRSSATWTVIQSPRCEKSRLVLFGAGHVGRALVNVLEHCDYSITWVDSRSEQFPAKVGHNVHRVTVDEAYEEAGELIDAAADNTAFVVMTHSHPIDYKICAAVLRRGHFDYLGLIGSKTKAAKFRRHFAKDGLGADTIKRLTCPIGISGVLGKMPGEIAVALAAELLILADAPKTVTPSRIPERTGKEKALEHA